MTMPHVAERGVGLIVCWAGSATRSRGPAAGQRAQDHRLPGPGM
jgi:hypothetical protein